uniref:Uncharacterized protein n=1 Tax=Plectus sambesii TaxID=2011161 RepID=A0A914VE98_9BILA
MKRFCTTFEMVVSKGEYGAKTNTPAGGAEPMACKMQVRIDGGHSRVRRQLGIFTQPVFI